jgi:hypothetical protein
MAMDRPAFPSTLPKPAPAPYYKVPAASPSAPTQGDLGTLKLLLGFAILLSLGNLALTIYLNQPKAAATEESAPVVKAKEAVVEARKVHEELGYTQVRVNTSMRDIDVLKQEYNAVLSRLANINMPPQPSVHGSTVPATTAPVTAVETGGAPK